MAVLSVCGATVSEGLSLVDDSITWTETEQVYFQFVLLNCELNLLFLYIFALVLKVSSPPQLPSSLCCEVTADFFTQVAGGSYDVTALTGS